MDLPFKLCKIGLKNTLFIFGRKMVVCCFVVVLLFCCCFVVERGSLPFSTEPFLTLKTFLNGFNVFQPFLTVFNANTSTINYR